MKYIKKKMSQLFLCAIVMQDIQEVNWGPVMSIVTCLSVAVVKNGRPLLDHGTLKSVIYISKMN